MKRVDGKVAIITGASSGIGRETAVLFAEEGAKIVAVGRNPERLADLAAQISPLTEVITVVAEAKNPTDTKNVFARALEAFGTVDILVNNAGIADKHRPALKVTDEFWDEVIAVDLTSVFHYSREALEIMTKNGTGAIVNISSIGVLTNAPRFSAYVASKAALDAWTRCAASEFADRGIHFTTINMPLVKTPMIAPTKFYDNVPTLSPDEAADLVVDAIIHKPVRIATRLGIMGI